MKRKWSTTRSEVVIRDRWIDLRAESFITPSGKEIAPYYVTYFPEWVNAVAITPHDRIVLARQYRHPVGDFFLEIPGGLVDESDASFEAAARRELEEETGYTSSRWIEVASLYANAAKQTNRMHVFLALDAVPNGTFSPEDTEEGMQVVTLPIDEVLRGLSSGLMGQALNVAALLMALSFAGKLDPDKIRG